jgi:Plasmid pRiA4b ORF-3-like protein
MALVYRFRVTFEDYDEVTRDIEIKSSQTFEDLHQIIQSCIGFDGSKSASFYISNDNWVKGQEISLEKKNDKEGKAIAIMNDSKLNIHIADPHQKIYYLSDFDANWGFMIELIKIIPDADVNKLYPVCIKSIGEAPKQYKIIANPVVADEEFESIIDDVESEEEEIMGVETEDGVEMDEIEGMSEVTEEGETADEEMEISEEEGESETKEEDY